MNYCRTLLSAIAIIAIMACNNKERLHKNIRLEAAASPFKFNHLAASSKLEWAKNISALKAGFRLSAVTKLEDVEMAQLGSVIDVTRINDRWFLLDEVLGQVVCFDLDGAFTGFVGQKGQGPGEYGRPSSLTVWDNNLVIYDSDRASYLVYTPNGDFLKGFESRSSAISTSAVFFHSDRAYLLGFTAYSKDTPYHAIMQIQDGHLDLLTGFGIRPPYSIAKKPSPGYMPPFKLQAFALVGRRIWVGAPFDSVIDVYDLDGRFVEKLNAGVDGIPPSETSTKNFDLSSAMRNKHINFRLVPISDYVVAFFLGKTHPVASIFTTEGDLLASSIDASSPFCGPLSESAGDRLVTPLNASSLSSDAISNFATADERNLILDAGLAPDQADDTFFLFEAKLLD